MSMTQDRGKKAGLEERVTAIEERLTAIEERNHRVEGDKGWETSLVRKVSIVFMTYLVIVLVMVGMDISRPWTNAIVPAVGFFLSTVTLPVVKNWWIRRFFKS